MYSLSNSSSYSLNGETGDIPILPCLYNEIFAYIKNNDAIKLDALLLPGKNPEKPFDSVQIRKNFHEMLEKIGIDDETFNYMVIAVEKALQKEQVKEPIQFRGVV